MPLKPGDIQRIHGLFGDVATIIDQRRTVYRAIIELVTGTAADSRVSVDVLDNPHVRSHLAAVLQNLETFDPRRMYSICDLLAPGASARIAGAEVRLASSPHAARALRDALARIGGEMLRHGDDDVGMRVLSVTDDGFRESSGRVLAGARLAADIAPQLVLDLLPHIALIAATAAAGSARLGSASAREFPGLIVVPDPETELEVAEAIVHEGAHQKLFDLALTRAVFGVRSDPMPSFRPSWAPVKSPSWPLEQGLAAFHAYHCLAAFYGEMDQSYRRELHSYSLLPVAGSRATEIGDWLLDQGVHLLRDGHTLLEELHGRRPYANSPIEDDGRRVEELITSGESRVVVPCGSRTLVAQRVPHVELFWVPTPG